MNILKEFVGKKVNFNCIYDLLGILKTRIADPNKHIIKFFVQLTALVFEIMPEK